MINLLSATTVYCMGKNRSKCIMSRIQISAWFIQKKINRIRKDQQFDGNINEFTIMSVCMSFANIFPISAFNWKKTDRTKPWLIGALKVPSNRTNPINNVRLTGWCIWAATAATTTKTTASAASSIVTISLLAIFRH